MSVTSLSSSLYIDIINGTVAIKTVILITDDAIAPVRVLLFRKATEKF